MTDIISSLDAIADRYDALLCDLWGVVHNGRRAFPAAVTALQRFRARGGIVVLISNVPKPRDPIPGQLDALGVPRDAWDEIVTSGDAIRVELARRAPGPMYRIGPDDDSELWAGLGLAETRDPAAAAFLAISGLDDPLRETPQDYGPLLDAARARDLELLCANPDIVVRVGERLVWCAGAVAAEYEARGGRVVMAGKPHPPIYALAETALAAVAGRSIDRSRILAVGDGAGTDVKGANGHGVDALFVATGIHGEAVLKDGLLDPAGVAATLAKAGATARYAAAALA
ncbi:MAG: TIGR01459 family HAD-type hydrolase [Alphaproteobacteria bacterium]|nr:TIGR01459 family HAD-type hydrolase [Alphaproteobacteria bacterium]